MDPNAFLDAVERDHETELSRLASSKVLYALTNGAMDDDAVFAALTARATAAAEPFAGWAADEEADEAAARVFETAAESLRDDVDTIEAAADAARATPESAREDLPPPGPLFDQLEGLDATLDRAAGLAAWSLVEDGVRGQAVGFFVGRADPSSADTFRELRSPIGSVKADALDRLDAVATADADWDRAVEVAGGIIDAAYGHYVDVLESLGIKVKPVC